MLWLRLASVHGLPSDLLVAVCFHLPPALTVVAAAAWFDTLADECAQDGAAGLYS